MDSKEVANRLEIVKLSIPINDKETIALQSRYFKESDELKLKEIALLLDKKNYRQALYLIKKYAEDNDIYIESLSSEEGERENVLDVEDMLKMSPIAVETIEEFKRKGYTKDDLEKFSKNIIKPQIESLKDEKSENKDFVSDIKTKDKKVKKKDNDSQDIVKDSELKKSKIEISTKAQEAISEASIDTPLDEMSSKLSSRKSRKRAKVLSKYKALRSKFSKDKHKVDNTIEDNSEVKQENIYSDDIYPPIPHIEEKFKQFLVLYPPLKESDIWVEDVAKFLKHISLNSYKDSDVEKFLDEYFSYKEKGDIARASQFLLLAAATEAKYAKFLLARELFKGKLLKRNLKLSYDLMKKLANSGYADAICDLGQFYEYGVLVEENKKIALKLYEKAFELGLQRATKHINRLKEKRILFSFLKGFSK